MTIYLYSGTPGSGKSLHAAEDIRYRLNKRDARPIIANFDINKDLVRHPEAFHYMPNDELTPMMLMNWAASYWQEHGSYREDYIWLYLDEMQLLYNSRTWNAKGNNRQEWLSFFSQHRKYGYKVVFLAQGAKMIDNQFRMLVDYEVTHRKMATAGWAGWLMSLPFRGLLFVRVTTLFQTHDKLGAEFYAARRRDMAMYDTYATFDATDGAPAPDGGASAAHVSAMA